jgi:hypothetical protein
MRAITPTLRAAATRWGGRAAITAEVQDRRTRWVLTRHTVGASMGTDMAFCGGGLGDAGLHRVAVDASGQVLYCRVRDLAAPAEWTAWAVLASGACPGGDVALAVVDGAARHLRLCYAAPDGAGGYAVRCLESADGGAHWSAGPDVVRSLAVRPWVAADGAMALYTHDGRVVARSASLGGSWSAENVWAAAGPYDGLAGIGAALDAAAGVLHLAVAAEGKVRGGTLDTASGTWTGPTNIAPGGDGLVTGASMVAEPAVEVVGGRCFVSWIDRFDGSPAWVQPVVAVTSDGVHYGEEVALALGAETHRRVALAHCVDGGVIYAANERCAACHVVDGGATAEGTTRHVLADLPVARYRRATTEMGGRVQVEVPNPSGVYDGPGRGGSPAEPVRPLSTLIVRRGYITPLGAEVVALEPHYIVSARTVQGMRTHPTGGDIGRMVIDAVDGWGLLGLWRPQESLTWEGATIAWLLGELCARVGLRFRSDDPAYHRPVPRFTVTATTTASEACRRLLRLAGGMVRFEGDGAMRGLTLLGHAPEPSDVGRSGEIAVGAFGVGLPEGTSFRVYGHPAAGATTAGEVSYLSMDLGLRMHVHHTDYGLADAGMAAAARDDLWLRAHMAQRSERVTIPLRPELEMWDRIRLYPSGAAILPGDRERRLIAIAEEWDAARGRYLSRLSLGGV